MSHLDELMSNSMHKLQIKRTFYFDESNNIRKGTIGLPNDNNPDLGNLCFVLGGIAVENKIDFDALLNFVGAKQTPRDAKFKFFSYGESSFEGSIAQPRLRKLFEFLLKKNIYIHFDVIHYMHFALIDILDSLIQEDDVIQMSAFCYYQQLQSDMTEVLYKDYQALHNILVEFEFPNIPKGKATAFINRILNLYCDNLAYFDSGSPEFFTKELLRQIIKAKENRTNMYFLEGNKPFEISNSLYFDYLARASEILDTKHFDNEPTIAKELYAFDKNYKEKLNMDFVDSSICREVQISDVICGFVSRMYSFLGHNDKGALTNFINGLENNSELIRTLKAFIKLMDKSDCASQLMFKKTVPLFLESRFSLFYKLIEEK